MLLSTHTHLKLTTHEAHAQTYSTQQQRIRGTHPTNARPGLAKHGQNTKILILAEYSLAKCSQDQTNTHSGTKHPQTSRHRRSTHTNTPANPPTSTSANFDNWPNSNWPKWSVLETLSNNDQAFGLDIKQRLPCGCMPTVFHLRSPSNWAVPSGALRFFSLGEYGPCSRRCPTTIRPPLVLMDPMDSRGAIASMSTGQHFLNTSAHTQKMTSVLTEPTAHVNTSIMQHMRDVTYCHVRRHTHRTLDITGHSVHSDLQDKSRLTCAHHALLFACGVCGRTLF